MKYIRFSLKYLSAVIGINFLLSSASIAASAPSIATMLVNFSEAVPNLMRLVTALAYVMGFFFIIKGVMDLKHFGESRSMMSQEHSLFKPLMMILVGSLLLYLPSSVITGMNTFWTEPNPYGYLSSSGESNWTDLTDAAFMVVQLVGTIAFIKGLVMLTKVSGHGQPDTFSKAMAHIIAGVLCINLYQFLQAVFDTLGISMFGP
ncbi:MAG TPA: hypothetical protein VLI69_05790 [Gammaproteobacteria bacterium]|nr:hypothetical protein [Gammaproteobacteria bacterium]